MADAFTKKDASAAKNVVSERHAEILNGYQAGTSRFCAWANEKLGDLKLLAWSYGRLDMLWTIDDRFVMPDGVMFGGHVASVADHVAGLLTMSTLDDSADRFRTSRLETNFMRPIVKPSVKIAGRAVNVAATLIHVEADFLNLEGRLAARVFATQVRRRAQ